MQVIAELIIRSMVSVAFYITYHTARIVLRIFSFGLIRVQGSLVAYPDEPEFAWHNVIWKWDGKFSWLSDQFALYFGFFLWCAALTALVYYWHFFG